MTLLIITPFIPYPFDSGGAVAQFAVLEELQHHCHITLCFPVFTQQQAAWAAALQNHLPRVTVRTLDHQQAAVPPSTLSRLAQGLRKLLRRQKPESGGRFNELDHPQFIRPAHINHNFFNRVSTVLHQAFFDIIQVEFFEFLELGLLLPSESAKVFVHHEIRFNRLQHAAKLEAAGNESFNRFSVRRALINETAYLQCFDGVITFSSIDKAALQPFLTKPICVIPFPVLNKELISNAVTTAPDKLSFIGGEDHNPNSEGIAWFLKEVFEQVWQKCKLPLYIIGRWRPETIQQYAQSGKVIFTGYLPDFTELVHTSVMVNPVRFGSGIRTKILYGMAKKAPVISTTVGAEGLPVSDGIHLLFANTPDQFVTAIEKIVSDSSLRAEITQNAYNLVQNRFSQQSIAKQRLQFYTDLVARKKSSDTVSEQ